MKRGIVLRAVSFALVAAVAFVVGVLVGGRGSTSSFIAQLPYVGSGLNSNPDPSADLTPFWEAWNTLNTDYVITHASTTLPSDTQKIQGAIQGLAASYGDPYTVYFPPAAATAFNQDIAGNFGGIGTEIDTVNGVLTVISPLKGTPAAAAGIKSGDQIIAINGVSTSNMSTDDAVAAIRGPVGSVVDLTIVRGGTKMDVKITRETIEVPEENDGPVASTTGVYQIALYEFTANSAQLFDTAFANFKKSGDKDLVIDLRGNPGGYLDAAVDIVSHFLPKGTTIVTEDYAGKQPNDVHASLGYDDVPPGTKIVVLIDGGSASASEILSGALQDNHAAEIIGAQSFGKGSVQELIPLDGGSLKVTVARWITPAGHWIMGNGITPDIKVADPTQAQEAAGIDPQIQAAVQYFKTGN